LTEHYIPLVEKNFSDEEDSETLPFLTAAVSEMHFSQTMPNDQHFKGYF